MTGVCWNFVLKSRKWLLRLFPTKLQLLLLVLANVASLFCNSATYYLFNNLK